MKIDIEDFYNRFGPMVYRRCLSLLKDEDSAYDALQEVFVRLIKNRERLTGKYPSSLLFRIATNVCLNMIQLDRHLVEIKEEMLLNIESAENIESRYIALDLLNRIFSNEKDSTRAIAVMHYVDRMKLETIASEIGMSLSGVKKRLKKLKDNLEPVKGMYLE